jgi:hypothetical protein
MVFFTHHFCLKGERKSDLCAHCYESCLHLLGVRMLKRIENPGKCLLEGGLKKSLDNLYVSPLLQQSLCTV